MNAFKDFKISCPTRETPGGLHVAVQVFFLFKLSIQIFRR